MNQVNNSEVTELPNVGEFLVSKGLGLIRVVKEKGSDFVVLTDVVKDHYKTLSFIDHPFTKKLTLEELQVNYVKQRR